MDDKPMSVLLQLELRVLQIKVEVFSSLSVRIGSEVCS